MAAKGNIRDYADLLHLVVLNNLEKKPLEDDREYEELGLNEDNRPIALGFIDLLIKTL